MANKHKHAANLVIKLKNAETWREGSAPRAVLLVWGGRSGKPPSILISKLGEGYSPAGPVRTLRRAYENLSGEVARLNVQFYARGP